MKDGIVWKIRNWLYVISMLVMLGTLVAALPQCEHKDPEPESSEFWPPDFIPHPHPPGGGPKKPSEGDLA